MLWRPLFIRVPSGYRVCFPGIFDEPNTRHSTQRFLPTSLSAPFQRQDHPQATPLDDRKTIDRRYPLMVASPNSIERAYSDGTNMSPKSAISLLLIGIDK